MIQTQNYKMQQASYVTTGLLGLPCDTGIRSESFPTPRRDS